MGEARAAVAAVIVADADDVALTHSASDGLNSLVNALPWAPGDRVLTTRHEHPGGLGPLLALRARLGVEVEIVDLGRRRRRRADPRGVRGRARAARAGHRRQPRAVDDGRRAADPAASGELATVRGRGHDRRRGAGGGRDPGLRRGAASTPTPCRARSGCSAPRAWARCGCAAASPTRSPPAHAGYLSYEEFDPQRRCSGPAPGGSRRRASTGRRSSASRELRLDLDVRRPAVGAERAARLARRGGRPAGGDRRGDAGDAARAMATLVTFRIAGWPAAAAPSTSSGRARSRSCATCRRSMPLRISVGLLEHRGGARAVRRCRRAARRATRPRRSRRAGRSRSWAPMTGRSADRPARPRGPAARVVEVRWRQFRRAPARCSARSRAACRGDRGRAAFLAYDVALDRGATLPGGDLRLRSSWPTWRSCSWRAR